MLERRRRETLRENVAEEEADQEVEVLKGGQMKALEDKRPEEDQMALRGKGTPSQGGEFLKTPSQPTLEDDMGRTPRQEETPKEWKTPKTPVETPRQAEPPTSSTREREERGGRTASAAQTPFHRPSGAPETSPQWPGGPKTSPTTLRPANQPEPQPLFDDEQLRRYEELRRQAPMLNPPQVQQRTLEEMRPETLREEELKRLRKREEELEMERTMLLREREELQRLLQQKEREKSRERHEEELQRLHEQRLLQHKGRDESRERHDERRQNAIEDEDVQYRTPEEESQTAKKLFQDELEEADRPPKPEAERPPTAREATRPLKTEAAGSSRQEETPGTLQLMAMMMHTMTEMQKKMLSKDGGKEGEGGEAEYVRSHPEVPRLTDWNPSTGPIDLNDWLALIEPIMADLTATSHDWWDRLLKEARQWYQDHMALSPMDRLTHEPQPSKDLDQPKWIRLERRASTLLMMSIPEAQKEELVSTKRITALKIICHLFTTFQPGGLAEKEVILRSLEMPQEAATVAEAVSSLRKWMRWRRRAMELQVSEPDPFLLLKGLGRIVRRPLEANRELNFRISLARSMLQVDSTPTKDTVGKFSTHLLAEMEQIAHLEGSTKSTSKDTQKQAQPEVKVVKKEEATKKEEVAKEGSNEGDSSEAMKGLLEEANKMLKALQQGKNEEDEGKEVRLQKLQKQLDELKTLKVFRISKIHTEEGDYGLLDSGATHALRGRQPGESLKDLTEVRVTLACGRDATLKMTRGGTMLGQHEETEPIVPLGKMVSQLGCTVEWDEGSLVVFHPERGRLATTQRGGCPHIPRPLALDIIQELEEKSGWMKKMKTKEEDEEDVLKKMVAVHPVFRDLPEEVKKELVVMPSKDLTALPGMNRRQRRKIQREGATLHLFAGEDDGFTLGQAVKSAGGDVQTLIELDQKRGPGHDLMSSDPYATLLRLAFDNRTLLLYILAVHVEKTKDEEEKEEGTKRDAKTEEQKTGGEGWKRIILALEQPSAPEYLPKTVSFWWTDQWRKMKEMYDLQEIKFNQGDWKGEEGGKGCIKPTTIGGNVEIKVPEERNPEAKGRSQDRVQDSKSLSRWVPGLMKELAKEVVKKCPLVKGEDLMGNKMRFLLVGAYTWLPPKDSPLEDKRNERVPEEEVDAIEGLRIDDSEGEADDEAEHTEEDPQQDPPGNPEEPQGGERAINPQEPQEAAKEEVDQPEDFEIKIFRLVTPLPLKAGGVVLQAVIDMCGLKRKFPPLGAEVLVKKRRWNAQQFLPTMDRVTYIAPCWEGHGHWVKQEDGTTIVARFCIADVWNPVTDHSWLAVMTEMPDPLEERRRLRRKTPPELAKMEVQEDEPGEEGRDPEPRRRSRLLQLIMEEMTALMEDPSEEALKTTMQSVAKLRMMMETGTSEDVLQTRIVGLGEVMKDLEGWKKPIEEELKSLVEDKMALEAISKEEVEKMFREAHAEGRKLEVVPGKLVTVVKPAPEGGKKKARIVACGNFTAKDAQDELYASTGDAVTLRIMMKLASENQWDGVMLDIRTAFLNTPWEDMDVLVKPPHLLIRMKLVEEGTLWRPTKALYGFRNTPRLWGNHRDSTMRKMEVPHEGKRHRLTQLVSEPNLWRIDEVKDEDEEEEKPKGPPKALMMVYVDDLFATGPTQLLKALTETIKKEWNTSTPEWINEDPTRFLGMGISKTKGEDGLEVWAASQQDYVKELLRRNVGEDEKKWPKRKVPISKDPPAEHQEEPKVEGVRKAQKIVGEALWLVTRTRPDMMYALAKMASQVLHQPQWVAESASQLWGYMAATIHEGITFEKGPSWEGWEEQSGLAVYADASFAPSGEESHGSVIVTLRGAPLLWKSSRQSTVSLSTAEAELNELIEGLMMGESVAAILEELEPHIMKMMASDSQAAVNICLADGGSWRTRHLRLRAAHAKQRFTKGDWLLRHVPGEDMLADMGTKSLTSARLEKLKKGLGMKKIGKDEEKNEEPEEKTAPEEAKKIKKKEQGTRVPKEVEKALQCVALMIAIQGAKAQDDEETEERAEMFHIELILMFALVGVVSVIQRIIPCLMGWLRRDRQPEEEPTEEEGSRVRGAPTRRQEEQALRTPESIRRRRRVEARDDEDTEEETDPGVPFPHGDRDGNLFLRNPPGPKAPPRQLAHMYPMPKGQQKGQQAGQAGTQAGQLGLQAGRPGQQAGQQKGRPQQAASSSTTPVHMLVPPPPPQEPGAEPPRLVEEFFQGLVQEEHEHPDDWDPEIHGQIYPGKGSSPQAYFQRMAEKGQAKGSEEGTPMKGAKKGKKGDDEIAQAKGAKGEGSPQKGAPKGQGKKGRAEDEEVPEKGAQKGGGKMAENGEGDDEAAPPRVPSDEHGVALPVYITPWGTRFHTGVTCPTLANSGWMVRSPWCPLCCVGLQPSSATILYSEGPGRTVHIADENALGRCKATPCANDATGTRGTESGLS
ncbi:unnamed protein product [Cladocopium goreaui]|uniref:Retrovirus-related Pol polyprotein from transposon RE2 (Retro element 2) (AtRE2) n=1 Tax=Cladocopium goreaui TaxID=2562237 RepID=A0A9P1CHI3_9DINO|nr:unnamed protein product [Cladocopium goreaui]